MRIPCFGVQIAAMSVISIFPDMYAQTVIREFSVVFQSDVMDKNTEKVKLTDDFLDQVVGGSSYISVSDVKEWKMARVVNLICYTTDSNLYMRMVPGGAPESRYSWRAGDAILVAPSSIYGNWIMAKADDGTVGWVDSKCVR